MDAQFTVFSAQASGSTLIFRYELAHAEQTYSFTEELEFPFRAVEKEFVEKSYFRILANHCGILLGMSYWKLFCPQKIVLNGFSLSQSHAAFFDTVYTKGLGEFFYKNAIDFRDLVQFPFNKNAETMPIPEFVLKDRSLVLVGGGKDSIVTAQLLKKNGYDSFHAFTLGSSKIQEDTIELLNCGNVSVKRKIDPQLFELNKRNVGFNGHIPISAIYAFTAVLYGLVGDYKYVISSNERSSNYGNVSYLGSEINHQWSKSFEFEKLFHEYLRSIVGGSISYFSLLRPLSELAITKEFVSYPHYFPIFSSCNRNYVLQKSEHMQSLWCGKCPKCAFVFVMMAAFLPKADVLHIFGNDLLSEPALSDIYRALLAIADIKPFECVGTPEEVSVAFTKVVQKGEFVNAVNVQIFQKEKKVTEQEVSQWEKDLLTIHPEHLIPEKFLGMIKTIEKDDY